MMSDRMRNTERARIGLCLLAVALLDASVPRTGFADEAGSGTHSTSVQPNGVRHDAGELKAKDRSWAHRNFPPRHPPAVEPSAVVRNAIGVKVAPHEDSVRGQVVAGRLLQNAAVGSPVVGASVRGGSATTASGSGAQGFAHPAPAPGLVAAPVHRGMIAGTGMTRPSASSSGLGGPAKALVGINGSTIRPKH